MALMSPLPRQVIFYVFASIFCNDGTSTISFAFIYDFSLQTGHRKNSNQNKGYFKYLIVQKGYIHVVYTYERATSGIYSLRELRSM
jgi:hypothetical protein